MTARCTMVLFSKSSWVALRTNVLSSSLIIVELSIDLTIEQWSTHITYRDGKRSGRDQDRSWGIALVLDAIYDDLFTWNDMILPAIEVTQSTK